MENGLRAVWHTLEALLEILFPNDNCNTSLHKNLSVRCSELLGKPSKNILPSRSLDGRKGMFFCVITMKTIHSVLREKKPFVTLPNFAHPEIYGVLLEEDRQENKKNNGGKGTGAPIKGKQTTLMSTSSPKNKFLPLSTLQQHCEVNALQIGEREVTLLKFSINLSLLNPASTSTVIPSQNNLKLCF